MLFRFFLIAILGFFSLHETASAEPIPLKLSLDDAISLALHENPNLKKSEQLLNSSIYRIAKERSPFFPELHAELTTGTYSDRNPIPSEPVNPTVAREYNQYSGQLILKENLFSGFESLSKLSLAQSVRDERQAELIQAQSDVALNVIERYFDIQLTQTKLASEKEIAKLRDEQLADIKGRSSSGQATELEYLQALYALKSQGPRITTMEMEIAQKTLALTRALGIDLGTPLMLVDSLESAYQLAVKEKIPEMASLYQDAVKENKKLVIARQKVISKNLEREVQLAKHYPKVDFILQGGTRAYLREEISSSNARNYAILLQVTVPLFSGFQSVYEREELAAESQALTYDETMRRENLFEQLSLYHQQLRIADAVLDAEKTNLSLTTETVKKAEALHRSGTATLTDLFQSYSQKQSALQNYSDAMFKRIQAAVHIKYLLGRLSGRSQNYSEKVSPYAN